MPDQTAQTRTIGGEMERRREWTVAERQVQAQQEWFGSILPPEMNAKAFITLTLGLLRKDKDLAAAAEANPGSLMVAATDCARQGLVPGEEFHFVAFQNYDTGVPEITGIRDYKGEIQLIMRTGMVDAVKCELVYRGDQFQWAPTRMKLPKHELIQPDRSNDKLSWVYAWAEMKGGGISQVIVMPKSEVMKHKDAAKSKKFWNGPWEPSMWKKTAIHELSKWVPRSAAWQHDLVKATAIASERYPELLEPERELEPPEVDMGRPAIRGRAEHVPPRAEPPDLPPPPDAPMGQQGRPAVEEMPREEVAAATGQKVTKSTVGKLGHLWGKAGWGGADKAVQRRVVTGVLAAGDKPPLNLSSPSDLTEEQGQRVVTLLTRVIDHPKGPSPAHDLDRLYQAATERPGGGQ